MAGKVEEPSIIHSEEFKSDNFVILSSTGKTLSERKVYN